MPPSPEQEPVGPTGEREHDSGFRPYLPPQTERRLARRLLDGDGARYVDDWRPPGCGKKLGEILEDETGRRYLFVKCDACTSRFNGPRYHVLALPRGNLRTDRPKHG